MSRFNHNDLTGETVAKMWHQIAGVISIAAAISGVGIVITAGAGALWHRWAVGQHELEIQRIKRESRNDGLDENKEDSRLGSS